jgi:hypothetical protein
MSINIPRTGYPIFEANQVLKHTDLTSLFNYLDGQQQLTRTHLIGMGIVCGLEVSVNLSSTPPAIALTSGCGLTSEGYLLHLEATQLAYYQPPRPVSAQLFAPTPDQSTTEENLSFYSVMELFEQGGDERRPLNQDAEGRDRPPGDLQAFLTDQVLVVVWESNDQRRDSCLIDCDDRGKDRSFRLRFFLLPRTQTSDSSTLTADYLLRQGYGLDQLPNHWRSLPTEKVFNARHHFFQDFELRVRRFGYTEETVTGNAGTVPAIRLTQVKTYDNFCQSYYQVCDQAITAIAATFRELFRLFSPLLTRFQPNPTDFNALETQLRLRLQKIWSPENPDPITLETVEAQYALQYFYDYLSQLVAAYEELANAAFDLMEDCEPDLRRFPKFLMLGVLPFAASPPCAFPSPYRSDFVQPPLYNGNALRVKQVRHLYDRLIRLCATDCFLMLPFYDTPLKITPSKDRSFPLSEQAIPYYLNYPNVYQFWSYEACRKGISGRHPAYFYPLTSATPVDLVHRLDAYSFYRIEGHIGEGTRNALEQVRTYQERYNLPFDIITLKIGTSASLQDLNVSGQLDDLEADFGRMKDRFLKLWNKNEERWSDNALINTLKRLFFDQEKLSNITDTQLFNPILALAGNADRYQYEPQTNINNQPTGQYRLFIINDAGVRIARYAPPDGSDLIDFSGLAPEVVQQEQRRIAEAIAAYLSVGKVNYGVEPASPTNAISYRLRLFLPNDTVDLPVNTNNTPRGTAPIHLLSQNTFFVNFDQNRLPFINQSEFQDFQTLFNLLDRDDEGDNIPAFLARNPEAASCLNYFEFKGLMEVYQQRLEKLMELHLFHKFAELHPGMEHLGGVPQGGTFILVYVDGKEVVNDLLLREREVGVRSRTSAIRELATFPFSFLSIAAMSQAALNRADIVVADFCLPYPCGSTTPPVSYILAQPRPIVLLEKTAFCEDDETAYEFLLDPPGGILRGEGSYQEGDRYYFQPSRIQQDVVTELAITFTYVVEGAFDTLTVVIYPEPNAELSISEGETYCNNDPALPLALKKGTDPAIELLQVTINGEVADQLDPSRYARDGETESVELVARLRDRRTNCENTVTRTVTINPAPNADFRFVPPPNDSGGYCAEGGEQGETVVFEPVQSGIDSRFVVVKDGESSEVDDGKISLKDYSRSAEPVKLTVIHNAWQGRCRAEVQKQITIFPIPDANLTLSTNQVCSTGKPIDITLNPTNPGQRPGTLQAFYPNGEPIPGAIREEPPQFLPNRIENFDDANTLRVRIVYTVTGEGGCQNSREQFVTVYRTPEVNFKVEIVRATAEEIVVRVSDIQPQGNIDGLFFQWNTNGGSPDTRSLSNRNFSVTYKREELGNRTEIVISLTVYNGIGVGLYCSSGLTERRVPIPPRNGGERPNPRTGEAVDPNQPNFDSPSDTDVLLNRRLENYRESVDRLRREVGIRGDMTADQFANRLLTLDRTVDETEAIRHYEEGIRALLKLYRQSTEEQQSAIAQLIASSTASLLDRLVIGDLTDDHINRFQETFNLIRDAGIDRSNIRSTWNPETLTNTVDVTVLDRLDQLLQ